ncbi:MAG: aminotransferase class I/II-fold pyridoxal phosphate-dependent enzyme [Flavobacteriales bacterium]|nr:aminotransferase class I/II-fold pyridoxal phosphate-dependent enzyme [Flavobacteriales bacterium]MBP9081090.1 aminotransferase class I/II-fold pyridoxal phosphate-dependent enzyme [Flavobacteriales bacterium]
MSTTPPAPLVSHLAEHLVGSEIIRLAGEINARIAKGEAIHNLTIGDFSPEVFPLPARFRELIQQAYGEGLSNYPPANGVLELRQALSAYINREQGLACTADDILIAGGARPLIYATYKAVVDPGDRVVYPTPSWNNNHYAYLLGAQKVEVETTAANRFLPTAGDLRPHLRGAALLALCSPLNPTGTSFSRDQLEAICDLVLEENARRNGEKPLYMMYDQIYQELVLDGTRHVDPVSIRPAMRPYTIYVDGLSKSLAATGVRVGWAFGPAPVLRKMAAILGHVGAWAPKPEQVATARFLGGAAYSEAVRNHRAMVTERVHGYHEGFQRLKHEGYPVDSIPAQGAIYLSARIAIRGRTTREGKLLNDASDIAYFLIEKAGVGIVPFFAFGTGRENDWFRLSVGTTRMEMVPAVIAGIRKAIDGLT